MLLIAQDLDAVAPFETKPLSAFLDNRFDQAVVERMLERMIGRMIDVNYHLITEGGQPPPSDYHASFLKLGELGIVDPEFARRIARCAGLRNRLASRVPRRSILVEYFESLQAARDDIVAYVRSVETYLEALNGG